MANINIQDMYSGLELDEESEYRIKKSVWYCYVVTKSENSQKKRIYVAICCTEGRGQLTKTGLGRCTKHVSPHLTVL
jgi:hypothetical protein